MKIIALSLLLALAIAVHPTKINADVPRPRGVSLTKGSLYTPKADKSWVCLDGKKVIRFLQINDDYCDCEDGSDEPGTAACAQGSFHCENIGYRAQDIPSSRVNDGICDCCDASDEWAKGHGAGECRKNCEEVGRAEQEKRKYEAELQKLGANKRIEMISKGKQMKAEREVRRSKLNLRRLEQEALKAEKELLKTDAEAVEAEALELYKEQQREHEAAVDKTDAVEEEPQVHPLEVEASFLRYDVNKDGFVEITELQVDMTLDTDHNGVVTVEEAKYYLDDRDRVNLYSFLLLSWPRIKPLHMMADRISKLPLTEAKEESKLQQTQKIEPFKEEAQTLNEQQDNPEQVNPEEFETEEEEDTYEDEKDVDMGLGSVATESMPAPEYDPETQRFIQLAIEARTAFAGTEQELLKIVHEIKEIDDQTATDYGYNEEYASLDGDCFKFEDREYVYTLCLFDRASQRQRSDSGSETTLGRWDHWSGEGDNKYSWQKYSHGASCWNGPQRSAIVHLKCALENRVTAVSEPNRCEYFFEFETPAACDDVDRERDQGLHDEL